MGTALVRSDPQGRNYQTLLHEDLFAPLKMDDTSYNVPEAKGPRLVAQQQRGGARMDGAIELQNPQLGLTIASPIGGGGLASTANDYGRFVRMFLNGGELGGARVLRAQSGTDGRERHGRRLGPGAQDPSSAQRRLLLHRGRP